MRLLLRKFQPDIDVKKPFDCGIADLNGFLLESSSFKPNATFHDSELLAVTYILEDIETKSILAYFSLLHDKIDREIIDSNIWNRFSRVIPNPKRRSSYTSLKIGRLAVDISMRHAGFGTKIIHYIENLYLIDRKAGCRFITVDALSSATPFYQKCKFKTFVPASGSEDTTLMYIDLKDLSPDHPHIHK